MTALWADLRQSLNKACMEGMHACKEVTVWLQNNTDKTETDWFVDTLLIYGHGHAQIAAKVIDSLGQPGLEGCRSLGHGDLYGKAVPVDDCARSEWGIQFCRVGEMVAASWGSAWGWQSFQAVFVIHSVEVRVAFTRPPPQKKKKSLYLLLRS